MAAAELGSFVATCIVTTDMTITETDALMNGTIHFKSEVANTHFFLISGMVPKDPCISSAS